MGRSLQCVDGGVTFEGPHSEELISITHYVTPSASHIQGEHFRRTLHFTINSAYTNVNSLLLVGR